ncbi:MAG: MmcQ/YjbR family DNA-binding protein [Burkholderiales bacterium]
MRLETLLKYCATFPHATQEIKWGNNLTCCVHKKMFAVFVLDEKNRPMRLGFKADRARFLELTDREGIVPAPYLARAKWVAVDSPKALSDAEAKTLLRTAYELIVSKLPKNIREEIAAMRIVKNIL